MYLVYLTSLEDIQNFYSTQNIHTLRIKSSLSRYVRVHVLVSTIALGSLEMKKCVVLSCSELQIMQ